MNFLDLPIEIRLHIYAYLLIAQKPIRFFRALGSAILRTSKQVLLEASPVLYGNNKFELIYAIDEGHYTEETWKQPRAPRFLEWIGSQSHLVRHVSIRLSTFNTGGCATNYRFGLNKPDTEELTAIQTMCPSINTLEFLLEDSQPFSDCLPTCSWSPNVHDHFQALGLHLKDIPSLEKVIVNLRGYVDDYGHPYQRPLSSHPDEAGENSSSSIRARRTRRDEISDMVQSLGFGWIVKMTEVKKYALHSSDGRRVFHCPKALQVYEDWILEEEECLQELEAIRLA
ncbi:hypothetical protein PG993_011043 [Apiospora rasikravindrae]|uniref:F-box domain-containing protein n=1 Tax=Apiospora rasikravindrae TaxID=990691 RepID=A0ABR1SD46_9PEZI